MHIKSTTFALIVQIILTVALCLGMVFTSLSRLSAESGSYSAEITAGYSALANDYERSFKVLRMEAEQKIAADLSFDEMQAWLVSQNDRFEDAVGPDLFDGFAFTYKGGYVHSWDYGDYSAYDPASRPWWQIAQQADGEIALVPPYVTFLNNTDYIESYDFLRMSVVQRYSDTISFDFDLNVTEVNALIADRKTIYTGMAAVLYDSDGYILSASDPGFYGHNVGTQDDLVTAGLVDVVNDDTSGLFDLSLQTVDGAPYFSYHVTDEEGLNMVLLIPFWEVFLRNFLFVTMLAVLLVIIEVYFYRRTDGHMNELNRMQVDLRDALSQAENASRAKGDFTSRISHEIRTPLNAIIGYMEIAKEEPGNPEKTEACLEKSEVASRHLLSIINDVLDVSSIESGRMKIADEEFDLKQVIAALTTLFYSQACDKGVTFAVHTEGVLVEHLVGDELRLQQILVNLLSNAVKFTPEGGSVSLVVEQVSVRDDRVHLRFSVSDTGIGMSPEYLDHIFEPFEQESTSTARKYGGTGLGLSISNNLVRMMGGTLDVTSVQGEGTTFMFLLAFTRAEGGEESHAAIDGFSHLRALVVDDEEGTCEYVRTLLGRCGVACDTVTDGKTALSSVESRLKTDHPYDLCIVDWNMEGMDGIETSRRIHAISDVDLPIIIATAYDYSSVIDEAEDAGVKKIISKPLFPSTMMDLLVNTFGKYSSASESPAAIRDFGGLKLLLVEDNEMNLEIAKDILSRADFDVTSARNGEEAVEVFEASEPGTFSAILMDVQMPIMDGYEATRAIRRSSHSQARSIPIIAMTANAFAEDVTAALAAGMNEHLSKPIDYRSLYETLSRLIDASEGED